MPRNLHRIRKEYKARKLDERDLPENPFYLFESWLDEAIEAKIPEPTAMNLSTVSSEGKPSSRIVLLKELKPDGLTFFTNYESRKAIQLQENPSAALNFFWPGLERQVRFEGTARKLTPEESDLYFQGRPFESQAGAWVSKQSRILQDRNELDLAWRSFLANHEGVELKRPSFWGGYLFVPHMVEFWQGRPGRLHDRIRYDFKGNLWTNTRLYP